MVYEFLYRWIANGPSSNIHLVSFIVNFLYLHAILSKISSLTYEAKKFILSIQREPIFSCLVFPVFVYFLPLHAFSTVIFLSNFLAAVQDRQFIFGVQIENYLLYHGIENRSSPLQIPCLFLSLHSNLSKTSPQMCEMERYFGIQVNNDKVNCGIENWPFLVCFSPYLIAVLSLP